MIAPHAVHTFLPQILGTVHPRLHDYQQSEQSGWKVLEILQDPVPRIQLYKVSWHMRQAKVCENVLGQANSSAEIHDLRMASAAAPKEPYVPFHSQHCNTIQVFQPVG